MSATNSKKKRRVSGEKKQPTIQESFGRQQQAGALPALRAVLEVRAAPRLVPNVFLEEALKVHEMYKEQQGEASRAIAQASHLRRSGRQRARSRRYSDDPTQAAPALMRRKEPSHTLCDAPDADDEEGDAAGAAAGFCGEGGDGGDEAAAGAEEDEHEVDAQDEYSRALCARWQGHASSFVKQVSKWVSPNWMLPLALQECLVHFVANHELHTTDPGLSLRALDLLQRLAAQHPHTKYMPADEDLPARVCVHSELWHPLYRESTLSGRLGATGFQLLYRLAASTLKLATGAPDGSSSGGAAGGSDGGAEDAARAVGRQGRALLLHYVAVVLEADLAARLRVLREAKASDDGGARAAETVLQGALLWRLLQDDNSWVGIQGDKVHLIRALAQLAVAGRAEQANGVLPQAAQPQAPPKPGAAAPLPTPVPLRLESLRALGTRLLRLLLALLGAAEGAGLYSDSARHRARAQGANDRAQADKALLGVLVGTDVPLSLRHPLTKGELLAGLAGRDRVRLLAMMVADVYSKSWKAKHPSRHLEELHEYTLDQVGG
ncbi:hypothetical protein MNEG_0929 [Monoraphidium neglectum]|uniref:Uncharacterized protein n=1 Tax=Monoraphidium neglectum TaxID=145388 RepID=A0A0D2K9S7_9CHLO|nr:hypothetical protein MNEG_0929 [Monoraphidium neglectum]KIZ07018.1 hypothetical protein MNEG_0929 [Monoraphidium neglectum]|eukprot:XP_013906037.1 hypothetical protein MNEG_0929 [Monoraphidium neglectum]